MKFQLKNLKFEKWCTGIIFLILVIFLLINNKEKLGVGSILSVLISLISANFLFLQNKYSDTVDKINSVKPIWKILAVDSEVEYFSLDKSKSVLDNVRYYSLIVNDQHKIESINKLNNKKDELIEFYFSPNALVESETVYDIADSPLFKRNGSASFESLNVYKDVNKYKLVTIIKAMTIFGDETYFFEGDELSGGLTLIKGKLKPYSGNWDRTCCGDEKKERAENYIKEIIKKQKENIKKQNMTSTTITTTTTTTTK